MSRHTDNDETVSIDVESRTADRLFNVRDYLYETLAGCIGAAAEPGDEDQPLDGAYEFDDPSLSDAIAWLNRMRRSQLNLRNENRARGRISGFVWAFEHLAVGYSDDLWAHVQETPAVHVVYSSAAHSWQGERDEDDHRTHLADAADPADLSLVVCEDGTIMFGGSTSDVRFVRAEDLPDAVDVPEQVREYQERAEKHGREYEKGVFGKLPNVRLDDQNDAGDAGENSTDD